MTLHYEDAGLRLFHGPSLEVLRADALGYPHEFGYHPDRLIPNGTYDSIVTDPPYELGFMGKAWDSSGIAYDVDVWRECLRVLKPGGHLLAFGGSRTWHRMAVAIEDAGFEVRDSIAWLYGSGFPKSMDVAKAIDKSRTDHDEIEVVRSFLDAVRRDRGLDLKSINQHFGFADNGGGLASTWTTNRTSKAIPTWEQWMNLKEWLGFGDEVDDIVRQLEATRLGGTEAWNARPPMLPTTRPGMATSWSNGVGWSGKDARGGSAVRDEAKKWEGWGTALKPAFEPIFVARKPFRGTVAANVLAHGTGALNIDATRTAMNDVDRDAARVPMRGASPAKITTPAERGAEYFEPAASGRWPTNVILDGSQAESLDMQTGVLTSGKMRAGQPPHGKAAGILGGFAPDEVRNDTYGDSGGASRFFPTFALTAEDVAWQVRLESLPTFRYEAKAPTSERPNVEGTVHATVKPLALIRWLVRLVTRPGGRVLDLYAGSGTTGEAALLEGMEVDLIELEESHLPLILARVRKPLHPGLFNDWEGEVA